MKLIRLIFVLLTIAGGCWARAVSVTEKPTTTANTELPAKSTIGLASSTTPSPTKTDQPTAKPSQLSRVKPATTNQTATNKADALYQVASNLLQKEKNWLQTEKWLIDNVYRLRNELTDIKRELSDQKKLNSFLSQRASTASSSQISSGATQLQTFTVAANAKGATFLQDLSSLRSDHTLITQQQQQLIQSNKDHQQQLRNQTDLLQQQTSMMKEQLKSLASISQAMVSLQQMNDSTNGNPNQLISKLMYDMSSSSAAGEQLGQTDKASQYTKQTSSISPKFLKFLHANRFHGGSSKESD